jgi:hypothetical protein
VNSSNPATFAPMKVDPAQVLLTSSLPNFLMFDSACSLSLS